MIQKATLIHSDTGYTKEDKPRKNEAKAGTEPQKKGLQSHLGYKPTSIINRNYALSRRLKTTTITSLFECGFIRKNEAVCKDIRYFEAKSKGHDATLKRVWE